MNDYDDDNGTQSDSMSNTVFHKIIRREIPAHIVFEDDEVIAIKDINPVAPVHILVIPKIDLPSLVNADESKEKLLGHMVLVAKNIAEKQGLSSRGYRIVLNAGRDGGQEVFQLHLHIIGGRKLSWPPG